MLILDEAQEALTPVLSELRILASKDLDARQLLCVVLAGDARLPERLRSAELLPEPYTPVISRLGVTALHHRGNLTRSAYARHRGPAGPR